MSMCDSLASTRTTDVSNWLAFSCACVTMALLSPWLSCGSTLTCSQLSFFFYYIPFRFHMKHHGLRGVLVKEPHTWQTTHFSWDLMLAKSQSLSCIAFRACASTGRGASPAWSIGSCSTGFGTRVGGFLASAQWCLKGAWQLITSILVSARKAHRIITHSLWNSTS